MADPVKFTKVNGVTFNQNDIESQTSQNNGKIVTLKDGTSLFIPKDGNDAGMVVSKGFGTKFIELNNVTIYASAYGQEEGVSSYELANCNTCVLKADNHEENNIADVVEIVNGTNNTVHLGQDDTVSIYGRHSAIEVSGKGIMNQNDQIEYLDITM